MKLPDFLIFLKKIVLVVQQSLSTLMVRIMLMKLITVKEMMVQKFYLNQKDIQKMNRILFSKMLYMLSLVGTNSL